MRPSQDCGAMPRHEIGFARVSRDEQNLSLPLQAQGDGSGRLFQDRPFRHMRAESAAKESSLNQYLMLGTRGVSRDWGDQGHGQDKQWYARRLGMADCPN